MSSAYVLGIDIGTSGVRAVAMREDHSLVNAGAQYRFDDTGENLRSPQVWWQGVKSTLHQLFEHLDPALVIGLSVDGTSGTVLPIDASGKPVAQPLMYNDTVEDPVVLDRILRCMPDNSAAGGKTSGLAKALHFSASSAHRIIHQADWIVGQLSGNYSISDANNALKTGYDPVQGQWPDWLAEVGMPLHQLPEVAVPGTSVGSLSTSVAEEFSMSESVLVVAGTTDGCASFLATGASAPGDAVTALGSTLTLKLLSDVPVFAPAYGVYSHLIGDQWLAGGASNSGGKVLSAFFDAQQLRQLSAGINTHESSPLNYYPLTQPGERFPVNDPDLQPVLHPRPVDDKAFLQGLLQGMAQIEAQGYARLVEHGAPPVQSVRSVGGGASNPAWSAIRQQLLGVPFKPVESGEAAAGTARLAVKGATSENLW